MKFDEVEHDGDCCVGYVDDGDVVDDDEVVSVLAGWLVKKAVVWCGTEVWVAVTAKVYCRDK